MMVLMSIYFKAMPLLQSLYYILWLKEQSDIWYNSEYLWALKRLFKVCLIVRWIGRLELVWVIIILLNLIWFVYRSDRTKIHIQIYFQIFVFSYMQVFMSVCRCVCVCVNTGVRAVQRWHLSRARVTKSYKAIDLITGTWTLALCKRTKCS